MMGPFDDLLRWPFDRNVELSLMNQKTGLSQRTWIHKCSKYPSDYPSLQKPKEEKNELFYNQNYHHITMKDISENPELIQNNQIFLKFSVK